ncbi:MAG: hypothetical protein ACJAVY_002421, partial [Marinoscillum sp.]
LLLEVVNSEIKMIFGVGALFLWFVFFWASKRK